MVNEGNDSEFENVLMAPLETTLPLNLEETVSIVTPTTDPQVLPPFAQCNCRQTKYHSRAHFPFHSCCYPSVQLLNFP